MALINSYLTRAVRNVGIGYLGGVLTLGLGFVIDVLAIRLTSVVEFGLFTSILALFSVALSVSQLGLQDGVARMVALCHRTQPYRAKAILRDALTIGLITSACIVLVLWLASDFIAGTLFHHPEISGWLHPLWLGLPLWVAANLIAAYFQGLGKVGLRALLVDTSRLATFCVMLIVAATFFQGSPFLMLVLALVGAILVSLIVTLLYGWRAMIFPKQNTGNVYQSLLGYSIPLLSANLITLLVTSGNVLALGAVSGAVDAAYYSVVLAVGQLVGLGGTALDIVLLPMFTELYASDQHQQLEMLYWTMARWSLMVILPIAFVTFAFPDLILGLLFGQSYVAAASALRLVTLFFVLHVAIGPNEAALKMFHNTSKLLSVRIATVGWMVLTGWLLAIRFGYMGMIFGWGTGLIIYNLILWAILNREGILHAIPRATIVTLGMSLLAIGLPVIIIPQHLLLLRVIGQTLLFLILFGSFYMTFSRHFFIEDRFIVGKVLLRLREKLHAV